MKKNTLSNEELSAFCLQISLLIHAGINLADGMHLLVEDEQDENKRAMLSVMADVLDEGKQMSDAMTETGCFPSYVIHMTAAGEDTGRLEQAFRSMAEYYEGRYRLRERIKSALVYPVVLLLLMLIIIGILLIRILPIFEQVYEQLGGRMDGLAGGLLVFGKSLQAALPVIGLVIAVLFFVGIVVRLHSGWRAKAEKLFLHVTENFSVAKKISVSRLAAALAMGLMSGLRSEDAMELAASFQQEEIKAKKKHELCKALLEEGKPLADALKESELLEPMYCRMLALGAKSGTADTVMEEIAARLEEDAETAMEKLVGKVEPTIVIVTSLLVGIILLAVMLPLMNIMATIG